MNNKRLALHGAVLCSILIFVWYASIDIRHVSGHSMEPALKNGQYVLISKLAYGLHLPFTNSYAIRWKKPTPGDIVCYPIENRYVIKRCIQTGGAMLNFSRKFEKTASCYAVLSIGKKNISLSYAQYEHLGGSLPIASQKVPEHFILALGDNPSVSYDSRDYGFISIDSIYGKLVWK